MRRAFWSVADDIIRRSRLGREDNANDIMRARLAAEFQAQRSYMMEQDALGTRSSS
jgi:hypothetical protein